MSKCHSSLFTFIFLLMCQYAHGQFARDFIPSPVTDTIPVNIHQFLEYQYSGTKKNTFDSRQKVNEFASEIYKRQYEYVEKTFNQDYFITSGPLVEHINNITRKILSANQSIPQDAKVFPYRDAEPNAISYGNGIIAIKLGLIMRLENDDQLAFIIGHELGHLYLKHTNNRIQEVARLNFDKEIRRKFNSARKSEYESYSKLKELMTSVNVSLNKYNRQQEFEADSLALIFLMKAGYHQSGALRCMEILDSTEYSIKNTLIDFKKHFNNDLFPFKENWIKYTKSNTWYKNREIPDSLKTHPNCETRKLKMITQLFSYQQDTTVIKSRKEYPLQLVAWFDLIESHYHFKQYGKSLFNSLLLLDNFPGNSYLQAMVGKSLFQIFIHQKKHELGKVVELPDPRFPENYDRILSFIQSLRLQEISNLSYHYITSRPVDNLTNEHVLYTLWLVSFLEMSKLDSQSIKDDYLDQYPHGLYKDAIKIKPIF